jgi:hypothetical protein
MNQPSDLLKDFLPPLKLDAESEKRYSPLGLKFNPFPRSGTANINASDFTTNLMIPLSDKIKSQVKDYISMSLTANQLDKKDRFISATITGDYGSGKTQLLMFIKQLLGQISLMPEWNSNPYVFYIDNPGTKLSDFIGTIISRIGEETFKKYIWSKIMDRISIDNGFRKKLSPFIHRGGGLFNDDPNPFAEENTVSYKTFIDTFLRYQTSIKVRNDFQEVLKEIILVTLTHDTKSSTLAEFFYELISADLGINKTWEALSSGSLKQLEKKESDIIRYIIKLIKGQGYTDVFILVDEFEDITRGRITKAQADNYLYNLRSLLDEHRDWCLLFAMKGDAMETITQLSPPLAERISAMEIYLPNLSLNLAKRLALNYLNIARKKNLSSIAPFDESGLKEMVDQLEGNQRKFLRSCYFLIEKLSEGSRAKTINKAFVVKNLNPELIHEQGLE